MKNTLSILISTLPLLALSQNINNDSLIVKDSTEKLNEVVVTGTMKAIKKSDSPVPIEIYTTNF